MIDLKYLNPFDFKNPIGRLRFLNKIVIFPFFIGGVVFQILYILAKTSVLSRLSDEDLKFTLVITGLIYLVFYFINSASAIITRSKSIFGNEKITYKEALVLVISIAPAMHFIVVFILLFVKPRSLKNNKDIDLTIK